MKGDKKRKKTTFKKGHKVNNNRKSTAPKYGVYPISKYVRLEKNQFQNTVKCDDKTMYLDAAGVSTTNTKLLRPLHTFPSPVERLNQQHLSRDEEFNEVTSVNLKEVENMINTVLKEHNECSECTEPQMKIAGVKAWGLTSKIKWKCEKCNFESRNYCKPYSVVSEEGKRGPKTAKLNAALGMAMTSVPVGVAGMRNICMSINQPAPNTKSLRTHVNRAYRKVKELNMRDMDHRRKGLKNLQTLKDLEAEHPIRAEGDGRYNNKFGSGGPNPFQPATQQTYTLIEGETKQKQIIAVSTLNKLCHKGAALRAKGIDAECPDGHAGCTANIPMAASIGCEKRAIKNCIKNMDHNKVNIGIFTSDGDSQAPHGLAEEQPHIIIETSRDLRHFKQTHKKHVQKTANKLSKSMLQYNDQRTRKKMEKRFADDLAARCEMEVRNAYKACHNVPGDVVEALKLTPDAIVACYQGDHARCIMHSFACGGVASSKSHPLWLKPHLPAELKRVDMTSNDIKLVKQMIRYRLGVVGLKTTKHMTTSQKSEAVNRAYNRTNPKDITLTKNYDGAIHAAIFDVNNRRSNAMVLKAEAAGSPISSSSRVAKQLLSADKTDVNQKKIQRSAKYKKARYQRQIKKYTLYDEKADKEATTYEKSQLDPPFVIPSLSDHDYTQNEPQPGPSNRPDVIVPVYPLQPKPTVNKVKMQLKGGTNINISVVRKENKK